MIVLRFAFRSAFAVAGLLMLMHCANPYVAFLGLLLLVLNGYKIMVD